MFQTPAAVMRDSGSERFHMTEFTGYWTVRDGHIYVAKTRNGHAHWIGHRNSGKMVGELIQAHHPRPESILRRTGK